jgi:hypothetical protein
VEILANRTSVAAATYGVAGRGLPATAGRQRISRIGEHWLPAEMLLRFSYAEMWEFFLTGTLNI